MCANSCPKLASSPTTPTSPLYQLGAGGVFFPRAPKKSGPIKRSKSLSDMPDSPVSPTLFKRQAQSMSSLPSMSLVPARGAGGLTPVDEDDVSTEVADFSKFMNLYGQEVLSLSYIQGKGLEELMSAPYRAIYKQRTDDLFNHLSALSVSCLDTEKTYGKEASKQLYFAYIFSQYPEGAQLFSVEGSVLLPLAEALVEAFETMSESVVDIYEDDSYFQFPLHLMQFQDAFDDFQTAFVEWQEKDRIAVLNDMTE